jgi:Ca2+-binding EF-hand superfamily protein
MNESYHHKKISNKLINTVPPRLMSDTVDDILNTFTFFDLNANHLIEINELKCILNALNLKKTTEECYDIINIYDLNNDQMIDFHEFILALARLIKHDVFTLIDIQQRFK